MRFAQLVLTNLWRRPMRSALTVLGIAVASGSFFAIVALSRGLEHAWINSTMARGTHILAVQKGAMYFLTTSVDAGLERDIKRVAGVEDVSGELADVMILEKDHTCAVVGWPLDSYLWGTLRLVQGSLPAPGEQNVVMLGQSAAEVLGRKPGDILAVGDKTFTIKGLFRLGGAMGSSSVVMPLPQMQDLMQRRGKVTVFNIRVTPPADQAAVALVQQRLSQAFPSLSFMETSTMADNDMVTKFFRAIAWSVSLIAVIIALIVVLNTLLMSVLERTREIGVLSAVGWPAGRIVKMILLEGLLLSAAGGLLGLAIGAMGLRWLTSSPRMHGLIEPAISPALAAEVFISALILGIVGSLYPAWRAAKLNPVDALKYE